MCLRTAHLGIPKLVVYPARVAISALGRDPAWARGGDPYPRELRNKAKPASHDAPAVSALRAPRCRLGWARLSAGAGPRSPAAAGRSPARSGEPVSRLSLVSRARREGSLREAAEGTGAAGTRTAGRGSLAAAPRPRGRSQAASGRAAGAAILGSWPPKRRRRRRTLRKLSFAGSLLRSPLAGRRVSQKQTGPCAPRTATQEAAILYCRALHFRDRPLTCRAGCEPAKAARAPSGGSAAKAPTALTRGGFCFRVSEGAGR